MAIMYLWYGILCSNIILFEGTAYGQVENLTFFDVDLDNCRNCRDDSSTCLFGVEDVYVPCRCDTECELYGDCCISRQLPLCSSIINIDTPPQQRFECRDLSLAPTREQPSIFTPYWIISTCPDEWIAEGGDERLRILLDCLQPVNSASPPVSDSVTGHVYANEYCAMCNAVENAVVWRYDYVCQSQFLNETLTTPGIVLSLELVNRYCSINAFTPPPLNTGLPPRLCYPQIPSTCLGKPELENSTGMLFSSELYEDLRNRCINQPFQSQVGTLGIVFSSIPYRNQYCAFCNGVMEPMRCFRGPPGEAGAPPPFGFSFTLLLDVNGNSLTAIYSVVTTTIPVSCSESQVFDPVQMQCRDTILQQCVNGSTMFTVGNCSCPRTLVLITLSENDTFAFTSNSMVLFSNEIYEIEFNNSQGEPVICVNFSMNGSRETNRTVVFFVYPPGYDILTYIGCSLSIIGCFFILLTYTLFKELRTLPGIILMNLAVAILVSYVNILINGPISVIVQSVDLCLYAAIISHFFFLSTFFWRSVMCFEMVRTFYNASRLMTGESKRFKRKIFTAYFLFGWGLSLLITIICIILNFTTDLIEYTVRADGTVGSCWINHFESFIVAFIVPITLSLVFCWVAFAIVIVYLCKAYRSQAKLQKESHFPFIRVSIVTLVVSGPSWLFGYLALLPVLEFAWYLFIILNTAEGILLCLVFLSTKRILLLYMNLLTCGQGEESKSKPTSNLKLTKKSNPDSELKGSSEQLAAL